MCNLEWRSTYWHHSWQSVQITPSRGSGDKGGTEQEINQSKGAGASKLMRTESVQRSWQAKEWRWGIWKKETLIFLNLLPSMRKILIFLLLIQNKNVRESTTIPHFLMGIGIRLLKHTSPYLAVQSKTKGRKSPCDKEVDWWEAKLDLGRLTGRKSHFRL